MSRVANNTVITANYCCSLIGHFTRYLYSFIDSASSETMIIPDISLKKLLKINFLLNILCLISDSTKTIRLLNLNF